MASLLYRLGHLATRRRWAVLIAWLALLLGLGAAAAAFSGTMTSSFTIPGTPAQAALDQLGEKIPGAGDATGRIVFAAPEGHTLAEPQYQQAIATVVEQTKQLPGVTNVIDPAAGRTVSLEKTFGFAPVAGDARGVVHQRQPPADQLVEQRRFADIGPADDGDGQGHSE